MKKVVSVIDVIESNCEFDVLYVEYRDELGHVGYGTVLRDPQGNFDDLEADDDYVL